MSDSILARPSAQGVDLDSKTPRPVACPAGVWTKVCETDSQRLAFLVLPDKHTDAFVVSPFPVGTAFPVAVPNHVGPAVGHQWVADAVAAVTKVVGSAPVVIHGAVYPLIVTNEWWAYSPAGNDLTIIEIIRYVGG